MSCGTELSFCKAKLRIALRLLVDISTVLDLILLINEELIRILVIMLLIFNLNPYRMMLLFKLLLIHAILRKLCVFCRRYIIWRSLLIILYRIIYFWSNAIWVRAWRNCLRSLLINRALVLISIKDLLLRYCWADIVWKRTLVIIEWYWIGWSPHQPWSMRSLVLLLLWQSWHTPWLINTLTRLRHYKIRWRLFLDYFKATHIMLLIENARLHEYLIWIINDTLVMFCCIKRLFALIIANHYSFSFWAVSSQDVILLNWLNYIIFKPLLLKCTLTGPFSFNCSSRFWWLT